MFELGTMDSRDTVLAFGTFDPLHPGHEYFLRQAKKFGDKLLVVVARDSYIRAVKKREPRKIELVRQGDLQKLGIVDKVILGKEWPAQDQYGLLRELSYNVLALGYDQRPDDETVRKELDQIGRGDVKVVRLKAYRPKIYKSSLIK